MAVPYRHLAIFTAAILMLFLILFTAVTSAQPATLHLSQTPPLEPLFPPGFLFEWFQQQSGFIPDYQHFGAYVMEPAEDVLYVGLSSARPAETDGALVVSFAGDGLTAVGQPDEQGIHDMLWDGHNLHIAGTDPCCKDDWTAGNNYTFTLPDTWQKFRDPVQGLTNVVHSWGLWQDEDGELFTAVGATIGDDQFSAQIFSSTDDGRQWNLLKDLGGYRAYDIIRYQRDLYATINEDPLGMMKLLRSEDDGRNWQPIFPDELQRIRLVEFQNRLLAVSADRHTIYAWDGREHQVYDLPSESKIGVTYRDAPSYTNYHYLVPVGDSLITVLESQTFGFPVYTIARTTDLIHWQTLAETNRPLIALTYWPDKHLLLAAERGQLAQIWQLDLAEIRTPPVLHNKSSR